jgi:hypothetical protein
MARNKQRGSRNNNPEGRNQYSNGVMDMARERPIAAAAAAAAAVGAGVFLWSRRNQITDQISNLSDQIGEWADTMNFGGGSGSSNYAEDDTGGLTTTGSTGTIGGTGSRRSSSGSTTSSRGGGSTTGRRSGMSETGGGNASLGAHSGGAGTPTS